MSYYLHLSHLLEHPLSGRMLVYRMSIYLLIWISVYDVGVGLWTMSHLLLRFQGNNMPESLYVWSTVMCELWILIFGDTNAICRGIVILWRERGLIAEYHQTHCKIMIILTNSVYLTECFALQTCYAVQEVLHRTRNINR